VTLLPSDVGESFFLGQPTGNSLPLPWSHSADRALARWPRNRCVGWVGPKSSRAGDYLAT